MSFKTDILQNWRTITIKSPYDHILYMNKTSFQDSFQLIIWLKPVSIKTIIVTSFVTFHKCTKDSKGIFPYHTE